MGKDIEHLIPHYMQSGAKAQEMGKKGGIKSGESKRRKAAMKDVAAMVLGLKPILSNAALQQFMALGINTEEITMQTLALVKQNEKAIKGDLSAIQFLRDTAGERPTENVGLTHEFLGNFEINVLPDDDLSTDDPDNEDAEG